MDRTAAAQLVFEFLSVSGAVPPAADVIIGFGHFDPRVPRRCCDLFRAGVAPRILFTGGRGAGTGDIAGSEAEYFREEARRYAPGLPDSVFLLEAASTNTSENVVNSIQVLQSADPPLLIGESTGRMILVATPYRQRRVWLTCRRRMPGVALVNLPPLTTFGEDARVFSDHGQDLAGLLTGEVERIDRYAELGYIEKATIPAEVTDACLVIDGNGGRDNLQLSRFV
jgi:hypothetical protein